uniref:Uncharacterized protein n=1 Tax=Arundo donax TaxID=35708 RepID=A0A0A9FMN5_ARUDO
MQTSFPLAMLLITRRAGISTNGEEWVRSSTTRGHTPDSITAWIFSSPPPDK